MFIARQRGFARRTVAIALFVLIPLAFGVLALLFLRQGQKEAPSVTSEATLTLVRGVRMNDTSGDHGTP